MAYKSVNVEITQEHFDRSIKGSPKEAVKELIWNACDADAKNIEVSFDYDGIAGAESVSDIYVKDDGHGIAIDHIDEVIQIIRSSANVSDAREKLQSRFGLSEAQSQAIVDMTLGRLSGLERQKIEERLQALYALIEELKGILADESKLTAIIKEDLQKIKDRYGDERRTSIEEVENEILIEDLIDRVSCVVTVTSEGYIKRLPSETYQAQRRGGKGVTAMTTKEEDYVKEVLVAHSHDYLLMFSNRGRLYIKKCYEIPEAGRTSKGTNLVNVLSLEPDEEITAILSVAEFTADEYLVMLTRQGIVKRVNLMAYRTRRTGGLYAVTLDEGDELLSVLKTDGSTSIIAATEKGYAIRFDENDVRCVGRQARGVRAVRLTAGDRVVGAAVIPPEGGKHLLTITSKGYGKQTDIAEFSDQKRGGKGVICHRVSEKTGKLTGIAMVAPDDDIMLLSDSGVIIRTKVADIPVYGRSAGGVIVMRLTDGASLVSFAAVSPEDEESYGAESAVEPEETVESELPPEGEA